MYSIIWFMLFLGVIKMKNKKVFLGLIILLILIISVTAYYDVLPEPYNAEHRLCELNPYKCVCEEWNEYGIISASSYRLAMNALVNSGCFEKGYIKKIDNFRYAVMCRVDMNCKSYRKLTQQELEIKHCKENPNDNERCFCQEYDFKYWVVYSKKYSNIINTVFLKNVWTEGEIQETVKEWNENRRLFNENIEYTYRDSKEKSNICIKARPKNEKQGGGV